MKRVIAYLRVSSEGQRENWSPSTQKEACLAFAEEQGWSVVDMVEEVYTSTEYERPKLSEVMRRVNNHEADIVLVYDQDRLAREQRQMGRILDELDEGGAEVWSVRQGRFGSDALSVFMTNARGFGSETENEQRTERTMRGQRARVEAGRLLGAGPKPTYGYRWPEDERDKDGKLLKHRYQVEPETAVIVRQVYAWALAGVSLKGIAKRLNEAGVPSPYAGLSRYNTSGPWRHQTVKRLIRNRQYRGEALGLAVTQKSKPTRGRKQHTSVQLPEGVIPALIDPAEWDRAQVLLASREAVPSEVANPEEVLLWGGIARCGNCGRAMRLQKRGNGHRYYACNKASTEATPCAQPSPSIKTSYIEEPVWALVRSVLLDPYAIASIVRNSSSMTRRSWPKCRSGTET